MLVGPTVGERQVSAAAVIRQPNLTDSNQPIAAIAILHATPIPSPPRVAQSDSPAPAEGVKQQAQNLPPKPLDSPPVTCLAPRVAAKAILNP